MSGYSAVAMDHFNHPRNIGPLVGAHARGTHGTPGAGNYMVIELQVTDALISTITFQTYGCPGAICCGSIVTEMAHGRSLAEARALTPDQVLTALGKMPLGKRPCAGLAINALRAALDNFSATTTGLAS